ncbi:uncharacterized protein BBA_06713 [Beauveria bassiana ARSEF 2860]|uniref:Lysine-specific metallo-endopeptidase domain-containing protein n=1 Tax=Beauveria bassiana (strain ARSEF 2860) TaxID=655819 RepID=J5JMQ6_BEAB2|nr:uncharacterized protein BBA_06713 [Beauveria bassiana ARSEF 2860]EJP64331.1 hypothetical protein BBA_06713 [Beauveria bassiana ARSEF 2860]
MAKLSGFGRLFAALLALQLLPWIVAVDISDIFTVQRGKVAGSCDGQMNLLNNWLAESTLSVEQALDAIDRYNSNLNVRKAMNTIFHIQNQGKMPASGKRREGFKTVKNELEWVYTFFQGGPYKKEHFWLFCDCTFLESHLPSQPAYDYLGNKIHDDDNEIVTIEKVKEYKKALAREPNARPWWSGAHSALKGYYFTEKGGDYCTESQLAATAHIEELNRPLPAGEAEKVEIASVILCPESFNTTLRQANYRDANNLITDGTNLADGVPRSATLLHEAFHAIRGDDLFSGNDESCEQPLFGLGPNPYL